MCLGRAYFAMVIIILSSACGYKFHHKSERPLPAPHLPSDAYEFRLDSLDRYQSCEELKQDLHQKLLLNLKYNWNQAIWSDYQSKLSTYHRRKRLKQRNEFVQDSSGDSNVPMSEAASSVQESEASKQIPASSHKDANQAPSKVGTNLQVAGVDEPDMIKFGDRFLFIANNQPSSATLDIAVVAKQPLKQVDWILIPNFQSPQLYTVGDKLIVTGQDLRNGGFVIKVYDTKDRTSLVHQYRLESQPVDSRMIGSKLFVVLQEELRQKEPIPQPSPQDLMGTFEQFAAKLKLEAIFDFGPDTLAGIKCSAMIKIPAISGQLQFQRVIAYDAAQGTILDEVAIPGTDSGIYMTDRTLYSYGTPTVVETWIHPMDHATQTAYDAAVTQAADTLVIKKVSLDPETGKLTPNAIGSVAGHLKAFNGQWAFHEMMHQDEPLLSVVTTTGDIHDETGKNQANNHLTVLRQNGKALETAARLTNFGTNEDVRSVRYVGPYAYVVTFRHTDPLFTIDLSSPLDPKIIGELKIPGFSLHLEPHANNRLLGVGYQTEDSYEVDLDRVFFQGVLFQLFDVENPAATSRLDFVELGKRGSYSEANQDHHAFYYDAEHALTGIPVVLFDDGDFTMNGNAASATSMNGQYNHTTRKF